jgi:hypothetical protein
VLALQQAAGNRAVGEMLARSPGGTAPTVKIGKTTIEVSGGNIATWAAGGDVPDALEVTSQKGKHSAELQRLFKDRTRIPKLTLTVAASNKGSELDLGSYEIDIANGRVVSYEVDGKTETWKIAGFDGVHRTKVTHTVH